MPPSYRAGSGSGIFGTNVAFDREGPDYGRLIDALTRGSASLIEQAYLRKQVDQQRKLQLEDRAYQRSRDKIQDEREAGRLSLDRQKFEHQSWLDRADLTAKGYHEDAHTAPVGAPSGAIARTMTTMPSMAPVPDAPPVVTQKAEPHFDLERSVPYRTAIDRATVTAEANAQRQRERLQAMQQGREFMAQKARELTVLRASLQKNRGGIAGALTGNVRERAAQEAAIGLLGMTRGSYDDAIELLNGTPEGKELRDFGVQPRHLMFAKEKYVNTATSQAIGLQRSLEVEPDSSVATVKTTRAAVRGGDTTKVVAPKPAAPAAGSATATRTPDQAAQGAAALIAAKKITFAQAIESRHLSDSAKVLLRKQYPNEAKEYDATKKK